MRSGLASYRLPLTTLVVAFAVVLTTGLLVGEKDTTAQGGKGETGPAASATADATPSAGQNPTSPAPNVTEQSSPTGEVQSLTVKILIGGNAPSEDQMADLDVQMRHPPIPGQKKGQPGEFVFDLPNPNPGALVCVLDQKAAWKVVTPKTDTPSGISDDSFLWCDSLDSLKSGQGQDRSVTIALATS